MRYLGVPLSTKKLTLANCDPLIGKILKRIQHWTARHLSYSSRVQLISLVLLISSDFGVKFFHFQYHYVT